MRRGSDRSPGRILVLRDRLKVDDDRRSALVAKDLGASGYDTHLVDINDLALLLKEAMGSPELSGELPTLVVICATGRLVRAVRTLRHRIIWDMALVDHSYYLELFEGGVEANVNSGTFGPFLQSLTRADTVVYLNAELADTLETLFSLGLPCQDYKRALSFVSNPNAVIVGSGLGNMMYATPVIAWMSQVSKAPIDVIVSGEMSVGVELFSRGAHVHRVYSSTAQCGEKAYNTLISTSLASHMEPLVTGRSWLRQNKICNFNLEGRFVPEIEHYFTGLERLYSADTLLSAPLPRPFLRDIDYKHPRDRVIGFANGVKQGIWAKRQWPHIADLVGSLQSRGFTMRCFGMPDEFVEGSENYTGLSIKDTIREISKCSYFVGHDCGITHIAEVIGVPTVWIFGPTLAVKNGPIFSHSRLVVADDRFSPCQLRSEWVTSDNSEAMESISVERVTREVLDLVESVERDGLDLRWRVVDSALSLREVRSAFSPSRPDAQKGVLAERVAGYPEEEGFGLKMALRLLAAGDICGAADILRAFEATLRAAPVLSWFRRVIDLVQPAPTPCGFAEPDIDVVQLGKNTVSVLGALSMPQLSANERRILFEVSFGVLWSVGQKESAKQILKDVRIRNQLCEGFANHVANVGRIYAAAQEGGEVPLLVPEERDDPQAFRQRFGDYLRSNEGSRFPPAADPFQLFRKRYSPTSRMVKLKIGAREFNWPHFGHVLLIAPFVRPHDAEVGSLSSLITAHAQQFAALGLRPVIVGIHRGTKSENFRFRDNVLYMPALPVNCHRTWRALVDIVQPCATFVYGADDHERTELARITPVATVAVNGLFDVDGICATVTPTFDLQINGSDLQTSDINADGLTFALTVFRHRLPKENDIDAPIRLAVMLDNVDDLELLRLIAARLPRLFFTCFSGIVDRYPINNVTHVKRGDFRQSAGGDEFDGLVILSSRPRQLPRECVDFITRGLRVAASPSEQPADTWRSMMFSPSDSADHESWRCAILEMLAQSYVSVQSIKSGD